jgi:hypothetical protein
VKNGVGIQGYDPVAYFQDNGAREGMKSIQANHGGVTYYFTSEEHKTAFLSDPLLYLPEYGGWCAYAIAASGDKVKVDPETYKILGDKLYLFYNFKGYNTLDDWNEDESDLLINAEEYWANIINN